MSKTHLSLFCGVCHARGVPVIGAERSNPKLHMGKREIRGRTKSVRADGFVFQTERAREAYPAATREKGIVIENAICNADVFEPFSGEKKPVIVSVGRLERVKGYDLLIDAFSRIAEGLPEWSLRIYGKGTQLSALQSLIEEKGLSGRVTLAGDDLHAYRKVKECEIFVLSSRSEGMPNTLLEALGCGIACVAADCENGPAELIEDGKNGLLVPAEDASALAAAMDKLARDKALRARLGEAALAARERYTIEAVSNAWLHYAEKVLQKTKIKEKQR